MPAPMGTWKTKKARVYQNTIETRDGCKIYLCSNNAISSKEVGGIHVHRATLAFGTACALTFAQVHETM